ncbi:uncharacterized protein LOC120291109 [Eucalyptus grandis]|uniref:uncharacterized protein LOC120291109 n=1 Tax=Eucalyptus grandis TaxID=71139 RepID=UPI00192EA0AA|nr:uncharacterized protein LOC120291109 [Eucalyptus grandis]
MIYYKFEQCYLYESSWNYEKKYFHKYIHFMTSSNISRSINSPPISSRKNDFMYNELMNRTSSVTLRYEATLPGGGRDGVVPVVGAGSYGHPAGLEVGAMEVALSVTGCLQRFPLHRKHICKTIFWGIIWFWRELMMRKLRWF